MPEISGERLVELIAERGGRTGHPCHPGCVIRCSHVFNDAEGNHLTSALEYETIVLLGSKLEIDDLDVIAEMDRFCDNFGSDTMETGHALAVAMEAGLAPFGDKSAALGLLEEIRRQTPLGRILGQGATVAGKVLGVKRVATVKGQGMAAYDPRIFKGTGISYATSPMGADHTAGNCLPGRGGYHYDTHDPRILPRCPFGKAYPGCNLECAGHIESIINAEGPETVAGVLIEPHHERPGHRYSAR